MGPAVRTTKSVHQLVHRTRRNLGHKRNTQRQSRVTHSLLHRLGSKKGRDEFQNCKSAWLTALKGVKRGSKWEKRL